MQLGLVLGHAISTVKHPTLIGQRLLLVQMLTPDEKPDGEPILVVDQLGAGPGSKVIATTDGAGAREMIGAKNSPVRWTVLGLADE